MIKHCTALAAGLLAIAPAARAQLAAAPYNEAVHMVDGKRVVDLAPFPKHMEFMVKGFHRPDEHPPGMVYVKVVETPDGLMDCNGTWWYHPKACSPSTFGREKFGRQWMVKMHGEWFGCVGRLKPIDCIPLIADGKLRALPTPLQE